MSGEDIFLERKENNNGKNDKFAATVTINVSVHSYELISIYAMYCIGGGERKHNV